MQLSVDNEYASGSSRFRDLGCSEVQGFAKRFQISQRETEILTLIVFGFSNREIAEKCVISEKTVQNHISNILKKIGVRSMRKVFTVLLNHVLCASGRSGQWTP